MKPTSITLKMHAQQGGIISPERQPTQPNRLPGVGRAAHSGLSVGNGGGVHEARSRPRAPSRAQLGGSGAKKKEESNQTAFLGGYCIKKIQHRYNTNVFNTMSYTNGFVAGLP